MMKKDTFDPVEFKNVLRKDWDKASGGWEKWWAVIEKGSRDVSRRLLELAQVREGDKVLDLATGIGEPAISAAKAVGQKGRVVAVDFSESMLDVARKRAKGQGLDNIEFLVMDGEELEINEGGFDAALCRWGLMFLPNPERALNTMVGLLKKGGNFAAAVWDGPEKVPMISLPMGVVRKELGLAPPPSDKPTPFSLADNGRCERMLKEAGLSGVVMEEVTVTMELPSADAYIDYIKDVAGPVVTLLNDQTEEKKAHVWNAVKEACRRFETPAGSIRMENQAICWAGKK